MKLAKAESETVSSNLAVFFMSESSDEISPEHMTGLRRLILEFCYFQREFHTKDILEFISCSLAVVDVGSSFPEFISKTVEEIIIDFTKMGFV